MAISNAFIILGEVVAAAFVIWGFFHEDLFLDFERRIAEKIKRTIRIKKRDLCAKWLAEDGLLVEKPR